MQSTHTHFKLVAEVGLVTQPKKALKKIFNILIYHRPEYRGNHGFTHEYTRIPPQYVFVSGGQLVALTPESKKEREGGSPASPWRRSVFVSMRVSQRSGESESGGNSLCSRSAQPNTPSPKPNKDKGSERYSG